MNPVELAAQREIDQDIVAYVREIEGTAPVRIESIHRFLTHTRRRTISEARTLDRVRYLVGKDFLSAKSEWTPGEGDVLYYSCTAKGRDAMDGVIPWDK